MRSIIITISVYLTLILNMNAQETVKIKITVGSVSYVAKTYDNATAKAFTALLPITVNMTELNGNEKYHYLSGNLPSSPENPSAIHAGDLMLYNTNCIVLFYETFATSYSYTPIGFIDNPTGLKAALGSNNPVITFEVLKTPTGTGFIEQTGSECRITNDGILHFRGDARKISLIDISGKLLAVTTANTLNVGNFPKGIYLLKYESQYQTKTIKIKI
ncbi:MAG TPA: cyclophilin-like fold protein [Bacteroidales bacterium]